MAHMYVHFHEEMKKAGYIVGEDWQMYIWSHDEVQFGCRPEIAKEIGQMACQSITWAGKHLGINILHEGEMKIGKNWCQTH